MDFFEPKTAKNQGITANSTTNEHGGAIVWIFIMIALFAALNYAVSKGTRTGINRMSDQQTQLAATEILDYTGAIKRAVQELQISGCSDTEVSFENSKVAGYTNPNAPTDESCHIFKPNGGGLTYLKPNNDWLDDSNAGSASYAEWKWGAHFDIDGNGTTATDLRMVLNYLDTALCIAINDKLEITNPSDAPPVDGNTAIAGGKFVGVYAVAPADNIGDDGGHNLSGKAVFCRRGNGTLIQFNQVLIAR